MQTSLREKVAVFSVALARRICRWSGHGPVQPRRTFRLKDLVDADKAGLTPTPTGDYYNYCSRCGEKLERLREKETP